MSVNKVILLGRLGQNPELKYSQSGVPVCTFSLATSESWQDKASGKRQEKTEWHRVVVWNRLAETCSQYLAKGRQVFIEGRIQSRSWDDKEGNKRTTTEILAQSVQFIGSNNAGVGAQESTENSRGGYNADLDSAPQQQAGMGGTESRGSFALPPEDHFTTDDIPF